MKKLKAKLISKTIETRLYQIPVPIVGLTGGIATGKSTVAELFRESGFHVIDADKLVKLIYQKELSLEFIKSHFPLALVANSINFKILRELAFKNSENQLTLETFIYSQMPAAFKEAYDKLPHADVIIYDVPLLFEKKLHLLVDVSVCVYSPKTLQLERLIARDNIEITLAENMLSKQMDIEEKKKKADFTIPNISNLSDLKNNFNSTCKQLFE